MTNVDLEPVRAQVTTLRWVAARKKELAEIEKAARGAVEDVMGDADIGLLDDKPAIHWSSYKRNAFDQSAFRDAEPDLYEQYKSAKEVRKFEVVDDD